MIALDLETELFAPGRQAPRPASVQVAARVSPGETLTGLLGVALDSFALERPSPTVAGVRELVAARASSAFWPICWRALEGLEVVGAGISFDLIVLAEWLPDRERATRALFDVLDQGRWRCLQARQRLLDIARGMHTPQSRYNLGVLAHAYGTESDKTSPWRLRYGELAEVMPSAWPAEALDYALQDATSAIVVHEGQTQAADRLSQTLGGPVLADEAARVRADVGLRLVAAHGLRVDPEVAAKYAAKVSARVDEARRVLVAEGLVYLGKDGKWHKRTAIMRERVVRAWQAAGVEDYPRTDSGKYPALDAVAADALAGQPIGEIVRAWADWGQASSAGDRVAEVLAGIDAPVHTTFDLAASGRSRSYGPNIQNRPTQGIDRECWAPLSVRGQRLCYLDTDHDGLELSTVAQVLIWTVGWSKLAEALVQGRDPHLEVGARLLGIGVDEARARRVAGDKAIDNARQSGKIANFGFAGGCGAKTFAAQALAKYGTVISIAEAQRLKEAWLDTWPEFREYFRIMGAQTSNGTATLRQLVTGRYRGGLIFTEACNTPFQGLGADLTMAVLYELQRATRAVPGHALAGCRVEHYVHDQYLVAIPRDDGFVHERAQAKREIVVGVAQAWLPDLRPGATPVACARWSKRAREVLDEHGRLEVWEYDPLIEAVWRVGGSAGEARAAAVAKLGEVGAAAMSVVGELEIECAASGAEPKLARRALDARMCRETPSYERGPDVSQARQLARESALAAAALSQAA